MRNRDYFAYISWVEMRRRCRKTKHKDSIRYRKRKINICERWNNFKYFLEDMGERPNNTTLDRINNNLGYCKENCRWATIQEQQRNRSIKSKTGEHCIYKNKDGTFRLKLFTKYIGRYKTIEEAIARRDQNESY